MALNPQGNIQNARCRRRATQFRDILFFQCVRATGMLFVVSFLWREIDVVFGVLELLTSSRDTALSGGTSLSTTTTVCIVCFEVGTKRATNVIALTGANNIGILCNKEV